MWLMMLTLSVMGYLTVIFSWGGLKDPQPKTGLILVQSLCQLNHVTRSLAWPITQKMRSLALKMKKLWAFIFLRKSWNLQESVKFIKEKLGGAIFKTPPFGARCTNLTQIFFKSCVITKYEKSRTFALLLLLKKMRSRERRELWVFKTPPPMTNRVNAVL